MKRQVTWRVGILGGMGPAAGADFARLLAAACADQVLGCLMVVSDQAFPKHWLAQVPVHDRSTALSNPGLAVISYWNPCCKSWANWLRWAYGNDRH